MSLLLALVGGAPPAPTTGGAGRGRRLADYEAEWANARREEPSRRQRAKARKRYFPRVEVEDVAVAYVDSLRREVESAKLAEMRALLDLQVKELDGQVQIAWAGIEIARDRQREAMRRLEEFDIVYIAAMIAGD